MASIIFLWACWRFKGEKKKVSHEISYLNKEGVAEEATFVV
jgi:hypothetical protein